MNPKTRDCYCRKCNLDPEIRDTLYQCDHCGGWSVDRTTKTEADEWLCDACYEDAPYYSVCCGAVMDDMFQDAERCPECGDHCEAEK